MQLSNILTKKRMKLTCLEFIFWATFAVSPFTVVYLREQGLSSTTIGLILSINSLIGIFSQPVWGMLSDWLRSIKKVFVLCFAAGVLMYVLLPFVHSALLLGIILSLNTFFQCSVISLMDTWIVTSISEDENISYGSLRLWGSIGFAVTVLLYGKIIGVGSIKLIFPIYFVIAVMTLILCTTVSDSSVVMQSKFKELKPGKLFKNYYYVTFVIFVFLISIPNTPAGSFLPVLFEQVGGTEEQYGMMHSIKAFLEIPFFLFGSFFLKKFGNKGLVIIAALIYTIQQFLFANASSPAQVMAAQLLLGPAYSLFLLGMLYYVFELAPDGFKTTAQTLASALGISLSAIISNYGGGLFIDHFGLQAMYRLGTISDIIAIVLFVLSLVWGRRRGSLSIS